MSDFSILDYDIRPLYKNNPGERVVKPPISPVLVGEDYEVIYEDPCWRFKNFSMKELASRGEKWGRAMGRPVYDTLNHETMCQLPIHRIAAKDAVRLTWATFPKLKEAIEYVEYWRKPKGGPIFEYKTVAFVWLKTTPKGYDNFTKRVFNWKQGVESLESVWNFVTKKLWHFGCGYYSHGNVEICLLSTKGSPSFRVGKDVSQLIVSPVSHHSAKPQETYDRIHRLFGEDRKYIELFAREINPPPANWRGTGLEMDGLDLFEALGQKYGEEYKL